MKAKLLLVLGGLGSLQAGMVPLSSGSSAPMNIGFFTGGTVLQIVTTGTVSLGGGVVTNPDGSTIGAPPASPYGYFSPNGATFDVTPPVWDAPFIASDPCGNDWANGFSDEGAQTMSLSTPGAIALGSVAGVFSSSSVSPFPGSCNSGWFMAAPNAGGGIYSTQITVPVGGANLWLGVADTYYPNNVGSFSVNVTSLPEPSTIWLMVMGIGLLSGMAIRHRKSVLRRDAASDDRA